MKVKELLKVLSKDLKVVVGFNFNEGIEVSEHLPENILEADVKWVDNNTTQYDLVIHI